MQSKRKELIKGEASNLTKVMDCLHKNSLLCYFYEIGVTQGRGSTNNENVVIFYGRTDFWQYSFLIYENLKSIKVNIFNQEAPETSQPLRNFFTYLENQISHVAYQLGYKSNHKNNKHLEKVYTINDSTFSTIASDITQIFNFNLSYLLNTELSNASSPASSYTSLDCLWAIYKSQNNINY